VCEAAALRITFLLLEFISEKRSANKAWWSNIWWITCTFFLKLAFTSIWEVVPLPNACIGGLTLGSARCYRVRSRVSNSKFLYQNLQGNIIWVFESTDLTL
jgi:hypothetical protein